MNNIVYRQHLSNSTLPENPEDKATTARELAEAITGSTQGFMQYLQPHNQEDTCRLTIIVPQDDQEMNQRIQLKGITPLFEEPQGPRLVDHDSCVIPNSFQITNFGVNIDPATVANHPDRLSAIAAALLDTNMTLPEEAWNILNWTHIDADEETGIVTISWQAHKDSEQHCWDEDL